MEEASQVLHLRELTQVELSRSGITLDVAVVVLNEKQFQEIPQISFDDEFILLNLV